MQRQRSRVKWLAEEDQSTKYFQQHASRRRKKNKIDWLQLPDESFSEDAQQLQAHAVEFYRNLYNTEGTTGMDTVLSSVLVKVTSIMNERLDAPYTEAKVKSALFQMYLTKAPGPDGFLTHFFQRHWDICGGEVTCAVLNILNGVEEIGEVNQTLLV